MDFILEPWPWWLSGILVGSIVPLMWIITNKSFGISSSFQQIGSMCVPGCKWEYLGKHNRSAGLWTLVFVIGVAIGGAVANYLLSSQSIEFVPESHHTAFGAARVFIGAMLLAFGARYAGGCTSGHAISGLSDLNWTSLVAVCFFFAGGLFVTWVLGPWIF